MSVFPSGLTARSLRAGPMSAFLQHWFIQMPLSFWYMVRNPATISGRMNRLIFKGMFTRRRNSKCKGPGGRNDQGRFQNSKKTTVAGTSQPGAVMELERKSWNKPHIIKYNYKKFKHMLRNIQLCISMYFQNHNLRHLGMVMVHFLCRGSLSFKEGYRKLFTYRKNLVKKGQLHYSVDLKPIFVAPLSSNWVTS